MPVKALCIDTQRCHTEEVAKKAKLPGATCPKCGGEIACAGCGAPLHQLGRKALMALAGAILRSGSPGNRNNPERLSPCEWCGEEFGVARMRKHRPVCPQRPAETPVGRRDSLPRVPRAKLKKKARKVAA